MIIYLFPLTVRMIHTLIYSLNLSLLYLITHCHSLTATHSSLTHSLINFQAKRVDKLKVCELDELIKDD